MFHIFLPLILLGEAEKKKKQKTLLGGEGGGERMSNFTFREG